MGPTGTNCIVFISYIIEPRHVRECNHICLCNRSVDGETVQLQNGECPRDVAQPHSSSANTATVHHGLTTLPRLPSTQTKVGGNLVGDFHKHKRKKKRIFFEAQSRSNLLTHPLSTV